MSVENQAEPSWLDRIDKVHEPGYMNWITAAWAMMFIKQGIIHAKDARGGAEKGSGLNLQLLA